MQVYDWFYVDFVEGGQYGYGGLCFDQVFGDFGLQVGYWYVFFDMVVGGEDWCFGSWGGRFGWGGWGVFFCFDCSDYVFFGYVIVFVGVGDVVWIDVGFFGQFVCGWGQDGVVVVSGGWSGGLCSWSGGGCSGSWSGWSGGVVFVQFVEQFVVQNGVVFVFDDFGQYVVSFGENFDDYFVGFDVDDQFVVFDCFVWFFVLGGDGVVGD